MAITTVEKDGKKVLEYRFQPKLEDGTPIGGEQVVYGDTHDQLMDKAADNYNHLYRKNREFLLKEKMAPSEEAKSPEIKFNSRPLSPEERIRLSRELQDPEKIDSALDTALEAKFGAKPKDFSQSVENNAQNAASVRAAQEAGSWRDDHPEFHPSKENVLALATYVKNKTTGFTYDNFNKAYAELKDQLEVAPALAPTSTSTEGNSAKPQGTTDDSRIATVDGSAQRKATVPTSVKRSTGTSRGDTKKTGMSAEQFRRLSNEDRRKFLKEHPEGFTA